MTKEEFIKLVSKIDQTGEDEFKAVYNSPEKIWRIIEIIRTDALTKEIINEVFPDPNCQFCHGTGYHSYGGSFGGSVMTTTCVCVKYKKS